MGASDVNDESPGERRGFQGAKNDILFSLAVIVIPMVVVSAVLLGLVTQNQIPQTFSHLPGVKPPASDSSAFIIHFSATRLLTVASWTSTVATLLPSFTMTLFSYPVAQSILNASKERNTDNLPTPYQLSMMISVLSGSIGSLWSWFKYWRWSKRERVISSAQGSLIWLASVSVISYLIVITDSWLHSTTSTIQNVQAEPPTIGISSFGRGLSSDCANSTYPCSISVGNHGVGLINGSEGLQTLANRSSRNLVLSFSYSNQSYAFITDAQVPQETDYQAQTIAVKTQCTFISQVCGLTQGPVGSTPFNCSVEFSGDLSDFGSTSTNYANPSWDLAGVQFFNDSGLSQNFSSVPGAGTPTLVNPVYIGAYGTVLGIGGADETPLFNSTDIVGTSNQGYAFVLACEMTVYDLEFVWYNGSVLVQQMTLSDTGVVNLLTAPFVFKLPNLLSLAQSAISEYTPSEFLETWSTGFSSIALATSAGSMLPRENIREETRHLTLVARVPKAPLAMLVFLNSLYVVVGIFLALMAAKSGSGETKNVQCRLTVAGLAAKCFEREDKCERPVKKIEDLFAEKEVGARDHRCSKVSLVVLDRGGWKYDLITKDRDGVNSVPVLSKPKAYPGT